MFAHLAADAVNAEILDAGESKAHARRWEAEMSKLARAEMVGEAPEHGDAYLARHNAWGEQQRWPLPAESDTVTIGRASSADVCLSEDSQVSRVHAVMERVTGLWTIDLPVAGRSRTPGPTLASSCSVWQCSPPVAS